MSGFSDLPDPEKGRKMFEWLYGPERGRKRFRAVLRLFVPLGILAALFFLAAQITGSANTVYSTLRAFFSPSNVEAQTPSVNGNCNNLGNNSGTMDCSTRLPPRRPDGLYQADQMVGLVGGVKQGPNQNQVTITNLRISSGTIDLSQALELQNALIKCPGLPSQTRAAQTVIMVAGDAVCDIVGERHGELKPLNTIENVRFEGPWGTAVKIQGSKDNSFKNVQIHGAANGFDLKDTGNNAFDHVDVELSGKH